MTMRLSLLSVVLATAYGASAAAVPTPSLAPKLPLDAFKTTPFTGKTLAELLALPMSPAPTTAPEARPQLLAAAATCSNPRVRYEWDSLSANDKTSFVNAVKCLMGLPRSGQFSNSQSRYEDFVALHQTLTPNVHDNSKFLVWHRYYIWAFEDELRSRCSYSGSLPWFDETKYAGRFSQSSIFSDAYFGAIGIGGNCVTNGKFAGLTLNVGPGTGNGRHCLARNGDASLTANCNSDVVNACQRQTDYAGMAACAEGGAHAWGHNGIGAVMSDKYASPGDPVFFLHHAFIDRNFRVWQNADSARVGYINGNDKAGNPLTMNTNINIYSIRPDVKVSQIMNTLDTTLCYKYNY